MCVQLNQFSYFSTRLYNIPSIIYVPRMVTLFLSSWFYINIITLILVARNITYCFGILPINIFDIGYRLTPKVLLSLFCFFLEAQLVRGHRLHLKVFCVHWIPCCLFLPWLPCHSFFLFQTLVCHSTIDLLSIKCITVPLSTCKSCYTNIWTTWLIDLNHLLLATFKYLLTCLQTKPCNLFCSCSIQMELLKINIFFLFI